MPFTRIDNSNPNPLTPEGKKDILQVIFGRQGGEVFEPGFSLRVPVCYISYPYDWTSNTLLETLPDDAVTGPLATIDFSINNSIENYETLSDQLENFTLNNSISVEEPDVVVEFDPCFLDGDADGYVSLGDIESFYVPVLGMGIYEAGAIVGIDIAIMMDIDGDEVISDADFMEAITYQGSVGCVDPSPLTYTPILDSYNENVAFAYSLRKLRSSYNGPCMSVFLDVDKRKLGMFTGGINFWSDIDAMLGFQIDNNSASLIGNTTFDLYQRWLDFVEQYPFLGTPMDIGFDEDGYVDYSTIQLMMDDPAKAFGAYEFMTPQEYSDFMEAWTASPNLIIEERWSWKDACVVLVETWYDQRQDEQRNFKAPVNNVNENVGGNGYGRKHPFSKSTLMVGCSTPDKQSKQVTNHDGRFALGSGMSYGLGHRPWDVYDADFFTPTLGAQGFFGFDNDGILYPGEGAPSSLSTNINSLVPGWRQYWEYFDENTGDVLASPTIGGCYMTQEKTNAEYLNPFYNGDDTIVNPTGNIANSSGERTVVGVLFASGSTSTVNGINFGAANPGNMSDFLPGYTDRKNPDSETNRPLSTSQYGLYAYFDGERAPLNSVTSDSSESVVSRGFSSKYGEGTKAFIYHKQNYIETEPIVWPAGTYEGEPLSNTFAGNSNAAMVLGKQQGFYTMSAPAILGNVTEFIAWNDRKSDTFMSDYIKESKEYFTNKKMTQ